MASTISLNSAVEFLETVLGACIIIIYYYHYYYYYY